MKTKEHRNDSELSKQQIMEIIDEYISKNELIQQPGNRNSFENPLNERNTIINRLFESSIDIIVVLDKSGILKYASKSAALFLGYSMEELEEKSFFNFIYEEDIDETKRTLAELEAIEWISNFENRITRKNGTIVYMTWSCRWDNETEEIYSIGRDNSRSKIAEQNMRILNAELKLRTEELANKNFELERFAYIASHDLQAPLRLVTSFLQLFETKYADIVDERGKKYIQYAVDGAEKMKVLIKDLLKYSRAGSGKLELVEVDMNAVVKDVLLLFTNDGFQSDAEFIIAPLPKIIADTTSMEQIIQNLVGNALKYRGPQKPLISISGAENDQEWTISVKDNGIGIDPKFFDKIFEIFQRLHKSNEYGGTGIGLSVCKKIVERYNGKIWVESTLGEGANFQFSIPKP